MGREAKDTIGVNIGTKMVDGKLVDDIREIMPVRTFTIQELTDEQQVELILQALKVREGTMVRSRAKKITPKIQHNMKVLSDMASIPGMTDAMLAIFKANPAYSTEVPSQMEFSLKDYFDMEEETATETPTPKVEETKPKNGKGKK